MKYPNFEKANQQRTAAAAARTVDQAWAALDIIKNHTPDGYRVAIREGRYMAALRVRHDHPEASLAQLAAGLGITKDAYSAALRRALDYAAKLQAAQHGDAA